MEFHGRHRELAVLEQAWASRAGAFVPVYGRRRVGKSELLVEFLREREGIYFLGKVNPAPLQIAEFLAEAARVTGEPLLAEVQVDSWKRAFELVLDRWPAERKLALVLDEFQWTVAASPELPSVLQELWDRRLRDDPRFLLVVCGSYVGFMEREVLGEKSPLFGRRTALIHLKPFSFREARLFHPEYSLRNAAQTYFICGGVPAYLRAFEPGRSVEANIRRALLDEFGPLFNEPEFLLREELREIQNYHAILTRLATGSLPPREVAANTGIPERSVHYYLDQLVGLGYVAKRLPLTDQKTNPRKVRYTLADPLLSFWFRFVYPHLGALRQWGPETTFERRLEPGLAAWYGTAFERLCREALPLLYEQEGVTAAWEIGEYWDRQVQIDVVGLRDDLWTDLGECKWGSVGSAKALVASLRERVGRYPNQRNATLGLRAFVRVVPQNADEAIRWHSLAELYGE